MRDKLTGIYYQPLKPERNDRKIYDYKRDMALDICNIISMITHQEQGIDGEYAKDVRLSREVPADSLGLSKQFVIAECLYNLGYRKVYDNYKDDIEKTYIETYTALDCALKENSELKKQIEKLEKVITDIQDKIIKRTNATIAKKLKKEITEAFCWWKV